LGNLCELFVAAYVYSSLWSQVTMNEAMRLFKKFVTEFKIQYRRTWDREQGLSAPAAAAHEDPETRLYEQ
jgi:hypothetical protein